MAKIRADGSGLAYCTYLGGDDWDVGRAIAVDKLGNAYVVGGTWSANFPTTPEAVQPALAGLRDTFMVKLDPSGTALHYATYLGGAGQEEAVGVQRGSTDGVNEHLVFVAGWTNSADFPTTPGVPGPVYRGNSDGFVYRIDLAYRPAADHPWNQEHVPAGDWSVEWRPMAEFYKLRAQWAAALHEQSAAGEEVDGG